MSTKSSLSELFGDLVIYRDLNAVDERLPRYAAAHAAMGLASPLPPRKLERAYAQALAWLLDRAQEAEHPGRPLREIVYIGDTLLNDGGAFSNLREFTGRPGWCFIGAEKDEALAVAERDGVYQANRWHALAGFIAWLRGQGAALDEGTAVIVDIDKTLLGARGRNDGAIDRARLAAIEATLADAIGPTFDGAAFRRAYAVLNAAKYHPFTADNQDNLAYVCLMLSAGFASLDALLADIAAGALPDYRAFMAQVDAQRGRLPAAGLVALHDDIYGRVRAGDPTPFKAFRRREYRETVGRMGHLPDDAALGQRLLEEICLTREVYEAVAWLKRRGCLLLALSDKPDEATAPDADLAALGYPPLHRAVTHIVGQGVAALLPEE